MFQLWRALDLCQTLSAISRAQHTCDPSHTAFLIAVNPNYLNGPPFFHLSFRPWTTNDIPWYQTRPPREANEDDRGFRADASNDEAGNGNSEAPPAAEAAVRRERNASVRRIALHLKGARILVSLASRLDTPTAAATAAAVAAAAATVKAEAAKLRRTEAAAAAAAANLDGPHDNSMVDQASVDDYLDEDNLRDQSPDAEVLPRAWQVTHGAPVYIRGGESGGPVHSRDGPDEGVSYSSRRRSGSDISMDKRVGRRFAVPDARERASRGASGGVETRHGERRRRRSVWHEAETGEHRTAAAYGTSGSSAGNGSGNGVTGGGGGGGDHDFGDSTSDHGRHAQIRWREITKQTFDLLLVVDGGEELGSSRILLSMPEYGLEEQEQARREGKRPGGLYIRPTMAEYCLLLSVYFGEGDEVLNVKTECIARNTRYSTRRKKFAGTHTRNSLSFNTLYELTFVSCG